MSQGRPWKHVMEERRSELPNIKWIFKLARDRVERGRQFLLEHPWKSNVWDLAQVRRELETPALDGGSCTEWSLGRCWPLKRLA